MRRRKYILKMIIDFNVIDAAYLLGMRKFLFLDGETPFSAVHKFL